MKRFTEDTVKNIPLARKIDKFTYGLLYPAFFGNMVYDLMQSFTGDAKIKGWNIFIGLMIVLFNALDYMHLYADVENSIGNELENKNWTYIICDFAVSLLLFASFVFLKYGPEPVSLLLFFVVPSVIARYKKDYNWDEKDLLVVKRFAYGSVAVIVLGLAIYFCHQDFFQIYYTISISAALFYYAWYVFRFYAAKSKALQS